MDIYVEYPIKQTVGERIGLRFLLGHFHVPDWAFSDGCIEAPHPRCDISFMALSCRAQLEQGSCRQGHERRVGPKPPDVTSDGRSLSPLAASALALQRAAGNRATAAVLRGLDDRPKRQRTEVGALDKQKFWSGPKYGASTTVAGGTSVEVDLGSAASQLVNYGSKPDSDACTAVHWLNAQEYDEKQWVKGHLLNDNLGGEGISENLTPLTHTANANYEGQFESKVKNYLQQCYSHANHAPNDTHWYGARLTIKTEGMKWPTSMIKRVQAVKKKITTKAKYIKKKKDSNEIKKIGKPSWLSDSGKLPEGQQDTKCVQ